MKTVAIRRSNVRSNIPYPNAATWKEMARKFLDLLLMGAIGAGLAASLLFLMAIM